MDYFNHPAASSGRLKNIFKSPKYAFIKQDTDEGRKSYFDIGHAFESMLISKYTDYKDITVPQQDSIPIPGDSIYRIFKTYVNMYPNGADNKEEELHKLCNEHSFYMNRRKDDHTLDKRLDLLREHYPYLDHMLDTQGKIILTDKEYDLCKTMTDWVLLSPLNEYLQQGQIEYQYADVYRYKTEQFKILPDIIYNNDTIIDLKTTGELPYKYAEVIHKNGYDFQVNYYAAILGMIRQREYKTKILITSKKDPTEPVLFDIPKIDIIPYLERFIQIQNGDTRDYPSSFIQYEIQ